MNFANCCKKMRKKKILYLHIHTHHRCYFILYLKHKEERDKRIESKCTL